MIYIKITVNTELLEMKQDLCRMGKLSVNRTF